ncbi:MAG: glycosyltransferase family 39 protein [Candidatus Shapirobacteria bacterium]|jgi:4-amino-4-deoxy-L-arabinose transferase-like glycosyltransferase
MIKKVFKIIIFLSIIFLSFIVRKKNYFDIPIPGQSVDEYSYSWVGLSLIETGTPVGISGLPGYKNQYDKYININRFMQFLPSDPLTINYPWVDHPPLLGLITGGYAYLQGARVFEDTVAVIIRKPIILISTISVSLLMIFCWLNFGFLTGILSGFIYGTTPLIVLSSRMIQAENAIIPCFLIAMISMSLFIKRKQDIWLILAAIISGIATLFKLTGFVCYLFVFFALLIHYQKINKDFLKDFGFFLVISLPITFLFVIYGAVYDLEVFKNILFSNTNRFYGIGSNLLLELIRNQRLTQHKFLPEVWIISGWLIFLTWIVKQPKKITDQLLILATLSYLIIYVLFGSQPYGWYTFPFWPILIMILSRFLVLGIEKSKNIVSVFLISVMILGANIARLMGIFEFQPFSFWWRLGVSGILFILIISNLLKLKNNLIIKIILIILWIALIYTNIKYLNNIDIAFWWANIS